jgi:hypothetical protein
MLEVGEREREKEGEGVGKNKRVINPQTPELPLFSSLLLWRFS